MLEAHIVAPRATLVYAGGTTAYDLDTLREHLSDAVPEILPGAIELEVVIDDPADETRIGTWLRYLARSGIQTRLFLTATSSMNADGRSAASVA